MLEPAPTRVNAGARTTRTTPDDGFEAAGYGATPATRPADWRALRIDSGDPTAAGPLLPDLNGLLSKREAPVRAVPLSSRRLPSPAG